MFRLHCILDVHHFSSLTRVAVTSPGQQMLLSLQDLASVHDAFQKMDLFRVFVWFLIANGCFNLAIDFDNSGV